MVVAVSRKLHFVNLKHAMINSYLLNVTQEELNRLIHKYEALVKSKRVCSYISSVGDLLDVLEARSEISENSVNILKEIGEILQRQEVCERVEEYKALIVRSIPQDPQVVPSSNSSIVPTVASSAALPNTLKEVFCTVAENLGDNWRMLGRELGVKERDIIQINTRCSSDPHQCTTQVLEAYWKQYPDADHIEGIKGAVRQMNRMRLLHKINEALSNNNHSRNANNM